MNDAKILRAQDYPRMPWKNGGGSTAEITRDGGTGLDGFGWRVSIADIGEPGGFSTFAGYQRVITVLQGNGMTLCVDGVDSRALLPLDAFAFSGDSQVSCALLGGPIRDFNLIYAAPRYHARLQWLGEAQRFLTAATTVLVFSISESLDVMVDGKAAQLGLHDCLQVDANMALLDVAVSAACCVIELSPR